MQPGEISQSIVDDILRLISQYSAKSPRYKTFNLEYSAPLTFDLIVNIKVAEELYASRDMYFKDIPSEIIKFEKFGFAIDGESFAGDSEDGAEIEISIAVHPTQTNSQKLRSRLLDVVRHEVEHILQRGHNFSPDHKVKIPRNLTRQTAKTSYKYFILSDEIPAQVRGLEAEALDSGTTIKQCAIDYLDPFLELGFITQDQINLIIKTWKAWAEAHNIKFD